MAGFPEVGDAFGRYQITGILGRGGMGVVFEAIQAGLNRRVALKVLSPDLAADAHFRNRFIREAAALASLDSPHIIHIYEHGEQDGCLFIVTQLVTGGDLWQRLDATGGLPPHQAIDIVAQISSALADAHDAGVIHRDIKPANVLLRGSGIEDFAYLCDFGIAQANREGRTRTGGVIGTLSYLAPERQEGAEASASTDIYSLGCLLWAALTGSPPYQGTDAQVAVAHVREPLPTYPGDDAVSRSINAIIQRSLAKAPRDRYSSAAAMRTDLLAAAQRATERAERQTAAIEQAPAGRRGRGRLLGAGVALITAIVLIGAAVTWVVANDPGGEGAARNDRGDAAQGDGGTVATRLTCWTGEQVSTADRCTVPRGRAGLRWAFPSFDEEFARCEPVPAPEPASKIRAWFCPFADDPIDGVRYNEWRTPSDGLTHHAENYRPFTSQPLRIDDRPIGQTWRRLSPDEQDLVSATFAYRGWPFSVTVQTRTLAGVDAGCELVTVRSPTTHQRIPRVCASDVA